ncbi:urease accessory protein UreF [Shimia sp. SDUM112013]|uniref:urease accessory protein UreF n=1 Tax=Shimia sp. SDUM112013 TaxID=3136160 RepID=UPI0032EDB152
MATATEILTLTQWFSPAYPVGAFAYSHGLEWAVESDQVTDAASCKAWVTDVLRDGAARNDVILMAEAYRADNPQAVDAIVRALASSKERLMETRLQGEAFCAATSAIWARDLSGLTYPVAMGHAARLENLSLELTAQMYLQAFMSNLIAAAMRLVPLGQTEGQQVIRDLTPLCAEIASKAIGQRLDDLGSAAFLADIAAMKHETQYSRIFRT